MVFVCSHNCVYDGGVRPVGGKRNAGQRGRGAPQVVPRGADALQGDVTLQADSSGVERLGAESPRGCRRTAGTKRMPACLLPGSQAQPERKLRLTTSAVGSLAARDRRAATYSEPTMNSVSSLSEVSLGLMAATTLPALMTNRWSASSSICGRL